MDILQIINAIIAAVATIVAALIGYYAKKNSKKGKIYNELKYHSVHQKMETYKEYIKYEMEASQPGKEGLVKNFLFNMVEIYQEMFEEMAEKVDKRKFTEDELIEYNMKKLHEAIEKRSTYFYCDRYTHDEKVALEILVKKYHRKQSQRIEHFKDTMERIIYSNYYKNKTAMQSLIFENYAGEFAHILSWFDQIIDDINGDFSQLSFRGDIISE